MTRNSRRNSRAMRRKHTERLQATIDGMQAMQQRARAREALTHSMLDATHAQLERTEAGLAARTRELEHLRDDRTALVDSALHLVNMVRAECIGRPATVSCYAPRSIPEGQWRFMLEESHFDARQLGVDNASLKIDLIRHTMHVLHTLPTLRDSFSGHIHLRVALGDGYAGYALSERAILHGDDITLAARISEELAPMLLRELRRTHARYAPLRPSVGY